MHELERLFAHARRCADAAMLSADDADEFLIRFREWNNALDAVGEAFRRADLGTQIAFSERHTARLE